MNSQSKEASTYSPIIKWKLTMSRIPPHTESNILWPKFYFSKLKERTRSPSQKECDRHIGHNVT